MDYSKDYNDLPKSFFDGEDHAEEEDDRPDNQASISDSVVPEVQD